MRITSNGNATGVGTNTNGFLRIQVMNSAARSFLKGVGIASIFVAGGQAVADEVIFLNGDRLTGTIIGSGHGKLVLKTEAADEVAIDLDKVKTFSTDGPVKIR